jgi:polysaccharide chain length determinant protein (PEP-CTERM system associated)
MRLRDQMGLFPELSGPGSDERVVQMMQKSISVEIADAGSQRLSAFRIAYVGRNPAEVAAVANQLAAVVIEENLKSRQQQFSETAGFLESALQDTKKQLEQKEAELARVKAGSVLDLPESKQYHLEKLANLRLQLENSQDRVNRAQQEKVYLQSVMTTSNPTVDLDASGSGPAVSPQNTEIVRLEGQLSTLRARYGDNFPDVRRAQNRLNELKAQAAKEEKNTPAVIETPKSTPRRGHNPVLEAQINKLGQEIEEQTKLQPQLQEQIDFHSSKLEQEPVFEQRLAGLMRDYDTLRAHYNRLLDKKLSADMASELESRGAEEQFVILDHAPIPDRPYGPHRPLIIMAGLVSGLLAGIGLAVVVEMADESVCEEHEIAEIVGKSVLAGIPWMFSPKQRFYRKVRITAVMTGTVVVSAALGLLVSRVSGWLF